MLTRLNHRNRFSVNSAIALAAVGALSATPLFAQDAVKTNADQTNSTPVTPAPAGPSTPQSSTSETEATPAPADIQQLLSATVSAVLTPDPTNPLDGQLSAGDQARVKDIGQSTVLNDTVAQLQKAYQEKYGSPLDLRQNQQAVFPEDSFRVGVAMAVVRDEPAVAQATTHGSSTSPSAEPAAQQASAVATPDPSAPTPPSANVGPAAQANEGIANNSGGVSAASANGTTSSNTPANATASNGANGQAAPKLTRRISVTVPESNGLPETGLKLANQAGAWKIDVPNGVTPQSLEQSLQQQLQLAMNMQWPEDPNVAGQMIARHVLLALASEGSTGQVGNAVRAAPAPAPARVQRAARPAGVEATAAEPTTKPVRQTYREKRAAERAAREAKRTAQQPERQEKQPQTQDQPATPGASAPVETNR